MSKLVDDIRQRVKVDTHKDYEWGAMYRDIRVLMDEYDALLATMKAIADLQDMTLGEWTHEEIQRRFVKATYMAYGAAYMTPKHKR